MGSANSPIPASRACCYFNTCMLLHKRMHAALTLAECCVFNGCMLYCYGMPASAVTVYMLCRQRMHPLPLFQACPLSPRSTHPPVYYPRNESVCPCLEGMPMRLRRVRTPSGDSPDGGDQRPTPPPDLLFDPRGWHDRAPYATMPGNHHRPFSACRIPHPYPRSCCTVVCDVSLVSALLYCMFCLSGWEEHMRRGGGPQPPHGYYAYPADFDRREYER